MDLDFLKRLRKYTYEQKRHYKTDFIILPDFLYEDYEDEIMNMDRWKEWGLPLNKECYKMMEKGFDCIPFRGIPVIRESDAFRFIQNRLPKPILVKRYRGLTMTTKFSFEVPIKHLEYFDKYQNYYFALSFLCRKSEKYYEYIKDKAKMGSFIVLDNSYNELNKPDNPEELAEMFWSLGDGLPLDGVVSPDSDRWDFDTLRSNYEKMVNLVPKEKVWVVVRSRHEYLLSKYCFDNNTIKCSTFLHRPKIPFLCNCNHFLGLVDPLEIALFKPKSCDTSMPIKLAAKGMTINDWRMTGFQHYHTREWTDFFYLELTKDQLKLAEENIKWIKAIANVDLVP